MILCICGDLSLFGFALWPAALFWGPFGVFALEFC